MQEAYNKNLSEGWIRPNEQQFRYQRSIISATNGSKLSELHSLRAIPPCNLTTGLPLSLT